MKQQTSSTLWDLIPFLQHADGRQPHNHQMLMLPMFFLFY